MEGKIRRGGGWGGGPVRSLRSHFMKPCPEHRRKKKKGKHNLTGKGVGANFRPQKGGKNMHSFGGGKTVHIGKKGGKAHGVGRESVKVP